MASKKKTIYVCSECGEDFVKWQGRCPSCLQWNTLTEQKEDREILESKIASLNPVALNRVSVLKDGKKTTGSSEFDRALSGGLVAGSITLLGGDPGIGKSTLMIQVAHSVAGSLYISGEESPKQLALRAKRIKLNLSRVRVISSTSLLEIIKTAKKIKPRLLIVDSIQTIYDERFPSTPGSVVQVRECALAFQKFAKESDIPVILVGHVTKEGSVAGPRILEHLVDTVCYLEGEKDREVRVIRTVKHRFGATNEIGLFEMTDKGMRSLVNPSKYFLSDTSRSKGTVKTVILDGSRPFLVETQALCAPLNYGYPKRVIAGVESKRLDLIVAILERHLDLPLNSQDIFINIVGGVAVKDRAADLAIACAIVSSFKNFAIDGKLCIFGELSLTGDILSVPNKDLRKKEVKRLGYSYFQPPLRLKEAVKKLLP